MALGHAVEDIPEVGIGLDVIEFGGSDERGDHGPAVTTSIGSGEEMVLAAERDRSNGTLNGIVVELDATVIEEAAKRRPARKGVADRFCQAAVRRNTTKLLLEPQLLHHSAGHDRWAERRRRSGQMAARTPRPDLSATGGATEHRCPDRSPCLTRPGAGVRSTGQNHCAEVLVKTFLGESVDDSLRLDTDS